MRMLNCLKGIIEIFNTQTLAVTLKCSRCGLQISMADKLTSEQSSVERSRSTSSDVTEPPTNLQATLQGLAQSMAVIQSEIGQLKRSVRSDHSDMTGTNEAPDTPSAKRHCTDPGSSRDHSEVYNESVTEYFEGPEALDGEIGDSNDGISLSDFSRAKRKLARQSARHWRPFVILR
ncbi:hypothetical protein DPMN_135239 [Dreissena polymorpha]|uniref:Uncharacterized protein n=1 Tax=Dreissena polymorpha TaxID=45954 RepID=A0A9D4G1I6_DREPO|nr:hypothetical protein DPMN_135239 [Dreissena polymorpha]